MTDTTGATSALHPIRTTARWIGPTGRPLMSWFTEPVDGAASVGVIIVPPVGYGYWTSYRTLRTLAERLAGQGCRVVRFDYDGTGDSAGDQWDPGRVESWRRSVGHAVAALEESGVSTPILVGLRVGGTFVLTQGGALGAGAVVAWDPVVRGRRYVKELQLLGTPIPDAPDAPPRTGSIAVTGCVFSKETLDDLAAIDLNKLTDRPAPRVLIVDREDKPANTGLLERLGELETVASHVVRGGSELMLDQPTEYATVPDAILDDICDWIGPGPVDAAREPFGRDSEAAATIAWRGESVEEEVVRLGDLRLVAVQTEPSRPSRGTVLWLNSGSEHHVGPGRAWVEYARDLALTGYSSVRMDFSGWGESPDLSHAPGRPYDQHGIEEVGIAVAALRELGHRRVVVAGVCAGAWIALRAVLTVDLDGVIAMNPQLYWQPGDPIEADIIGETRVRRQPEVRRYKRLNALGVWTLLDIFGVKHPAAKWLGQLKRRGTPIFAVFAEGDDGLEFLEDRTGRAWRRALRHSAITTSTVPDIDHPMHRHWLRGSMIATIGEWLDTTLPQEPAASLDEQLRT